MILANDNIVCDDYEWRAKRVKHMKNRYMTKQDAYNFIETIIWSSYDNIEVVTDKVRTLWMTIGARRGNK